MINDTLTTGINQKLNELEKQTLADLTIGNPEQIAYATRIKTDMIHDLTKYIRDAYVRQCQDSGNIGSAYIIGIEKALATLKTETDARELIELHQNSPEITSIISYYLMQIYSRTNHKLTPLQDNAPNHSTEEVTTLRGKQLYRIVHDPDYTSQLGNALRQQSSAQWWVDNYKCTAAQLNKTLLKL